MAGLNHRRPILRILDDAKSERRRTQVDVPSNTAAIVRRVVNPERRREYMIQCAFALAQDKRLPGIPKKMRKIIGAATGHPIDAMVLAWLFHQPDFPDAQEEVRERLIARMRKKAARSQNTLAETPSIPGNS